MENLRWENKRVGVRKKKIISLGKKKRKDGGGSTKEEEEIVEGWSERKARERKGHKGFCFFVFDNDNINFI